MRPSLSLLLFLTLACGDDDRPADGGAQDAALDLGDSAADLGADDLGRVDQSLDEGTDGGAEDAGANCPPRREDDAPRFALVSFPFGEDDGRFGVYRLESDGTWSSTEYTLSIGKNSLGRIAFSSNGVVAMVAIDNGQIATVRFADDGTPTLVQPAREALLYASLVYADPQDPRLFYVLSRNTRANDGGIFRVEVDCEGAIVNESMVVFGDLPYALAIGESASDTLVLARALDDADEGDAHTLDLQSGTLGPSFDLFGDVEWIGSDIARSGDTIVGTDTNAFAPPNRVGALNADGTPQVFDSIEDPLAVVISPFADRVMVLSGIGSHAWIFDMDGDAEAPLSNLRTADYVGRRPQIPGIPTMIARGSLRGVVVMPTVEALHSFRFVEGDVIDLGTFSLGSGSEAIPGTLGIQP